MISLSEIPALFFCFFLFRGTFPWNLETASPTFILACPFKNNYTISIPLQNNKHRFILFSTPVVNEEPSHIIKTLSLRNQRMLEREREAPWFTPPSPWLTRKLESWTQWVIKPNGSISRDAAAGLWSCPDYRAWQISRPLIWGLQPRPKELARGPYPPLLNNVFCLEWETCLGWLEASWHWHFPPIDLHSLILTLDHCLCRLW